MSKTDHLENRNGHENSPAIDRQLLWQILQAIWIGLILLIGLPVLIWTLNSVR